MMMIYSASWHIWNQERGVDTTVGNLAVMCFILGRIPGEGVEIPRSIVEGNRKKAGGGGGGGKGEDVGLLASLAAAARHHQPSSSGGNLIQALPIEMQRFFNGQGIEGIGGGLNSNEAAVCGVIWKEGEMVVQCNERFSTMLITKQKIEESLMEEGLRPDFIWAQ